ncbi:preprotein translocase subunit SecA [Ectopseudomonas hydrolytica]|uniref:Protein translocase subunit SecA n=1 Tax=Ectopseudomonas mendocina (strain ymp) TaxID=399739 RepID=SECA_ECTM1|nr:MULTISPECIES: preprotein translocase subunit SecA [Pseudomonas]A4XQT3.2 RecName: Full=Protein translocase subunit SecA [Pseudomonas mendocina ymp]ARS47767.1 preprotein translocase subunit SecA [Pseudomonas mendocina]EJO94206.1 preprotein translocase subunit SecA [Pseudomonas mendocina DLHK]ATH83510.1 protein translocase subunit SecA [Pseudomonas mendocina]MBA4242904.1 protein translocase subunit SecA [Pseudomonas sp.]MBF8159602.1 preprotein translocase subunit SecA [Pseudomonas mendocina]
MFAPLLKKLFGSKNEREVKRMLKAVQSVNALEEQMIALSDEQLRGKTEEFKARLAKGETLDQLLAEAFAVAREAGKRVMGMRHFDVQLIGGMTLHEGKIAEMRTGEGKTLVGTLAVYLNALSGKGVHVVTVNEYLARRDANWMRPLYEFLGLTVGIVTPFQPPEEKRAAYAADITYGTNNEFGFDYLRDNMAFSLEDKFQRELNFAVIDEVDSILIDEARTPLIISGQAEDSSKLYTEINRLIPRLKQHIEEEEGVVTQEGHYKVDEKSRQVELNEAGHQYVEEMLTAAGLLAEGESLYSAHNLGLLTHVYAGLRAHTLFNRNVEYIVQNGQVILIDEHTGRTMPGRRLSEGLHQAIEAKEGVNIQAESQTLASTTFQNYFRLYNKLSGMTGTADTEAFEFRQIYGLDVVVIPTNKPIARKDFNDLVYLTQEEKYQAIITDIKDCQAQGRPILVGTASIETSEYVSQLLQKEKIEHKVLNAKYHDKEAEIIAQAGRPGAVTIATNMAGRGTDILLGGNWEVEVAALENPTDEQIAQIKTEWQKRHQQVIEAGGLHVIASERHESRRIDNQLRGRAGRQGDPGSSRFYLSLEDNLMRIFASDRVKNFMKALGMQSGEAIEHRMVTNAIEKAQRKVEGRNFDMRKQLLEFDDVANEQRKVIYHMRNSLLAAENVGDTIAEFREEVLTAAINGHIPPQSMPEQWDVAGLESTLQSDFGLKLPIQQWLDEDDKLYEETLRERILAELVAAYNEKETQASAEALRTFEKQILLRVLDDLWKDHLSTMDHLRHGIHLRGYAQKNPKQEYKRESFALFQELLESIKRDTIRVLSHVQVRREDPAEEEARLRREAEALAERMQFQHAEASALAAEQDGAEEGAVATATAPVRSENKVGRNEPCPCGSGKKYKHCHGQIN